MIDECLQHAERKASLDNDTELEKIPQARSNNMEIVPKTKMDNYLSTNMIFLFHKG